MIGSLEVTHELIFTIPSVIQMSSFNSIPLRFNLGKPQLSEGLNVNLFNFSFFSKSLSMLRFLDTLSQCIIYCLNGTSIGDIWCKIECTDHAKDGYHIL